MKKTILFIIALFVSCYGEAKVVIPSIWGDNMVLQQQADVEMWGKAKPNKKVTVTSSWNNKKIVVTANNDGLWKATVSTPKAGGPYELTFSDGEVLTLKNILIGEVWLCSGQSNMEMPVKGFRGQPVFNSHDAIVAADEKRSLRLFTVKKVYSTEPLDTLQGEWKESTSQDVANFSATAYFFADLLQKKLGVPVGIIHSSWSASKIEAWMDKKTISEFPEYDLNVLKQKEFGYPNGTATLLFNSMINPLKGMPIKGVIWYQGESNSSNPDLYGRLFKRWISQWREFFNSPAMPVYYVQIAPYQSDGKDKTNLALFRQRQLELMSEVPNVGMAITTDAGSEKFIHPPYKIKVGQRLAYWALAKTYGIDGIAYSGPIYKSCKLKDKFVEVEFEHGQDGLTPENERVIGFEIAGSDGHFLPAQAEIINGSAKIKVWNDAVPTPVEVRYCFRNYMEGNLYNNAAIPASPFRAIIK